MAAGAGVQRGDIPAHRVAGPTGTPGSDILAHDGASDVGTSGDGVSANGRIADTYRTSGSDILSCDEVATA